MAEAGQDLPFLKWSHLSQLFEYIGQIDIWFQPIQKSCLYYTVYNCTGICASNTFGKQPIPTFYFNAAADDKWIVIDGLQRLSAFNNFLIGVENEMRENFLNNLLTTEPFDYNKDSERLFSLEGCI